MIINSFTLPETVLTHVEIGTFLTFVSKPLNVSNFADATLDSMINCLGNNKMKNIYIQILLKQ